MNTYIVKECDWRHNTLLSICVAIIITSLNTSIFSYLPSLNTSKCGVDSNKFIGNKMSNIR